MTPSSLAACWMVTRFDFRVRWWRGRDPGALSGLPWTRGAVKGRPVPVRRPWRLRIAAICWSGWCSASRRISSIVSSPSRWLSGPRALSLHRQLAARAALPADLDGRLALLGVHGHDDLADQRAQQLLAVAVGCRVRRPQPRKVARESAPARDARLGERLRAGRARARSVSRALARPRSSASSSLRSKRAGDEPVLRLARVELPLGPLGFIFGALHREALADEQLLVLVLELGDRAGGARSPRPGVTASRNASTTRFLQSAAAEGLAAGVGVMHHVAAHARIPADLAAGAGICDLHPSAAATAADQPLQQRGALAGGAAALAARSHVLRAAARGWRGTQSR